MAAIVLKDSTAIYNGKEKGWEHRRNKKMILQADTRTSAAQYKFKFEGEDIVVLVNYENITWVKKNVHYNDDPVQKFPSQTNSRARQFAIY